MLGLAFAAYAIAWGAALLGLSAAAINANAATFAGFTLLMPHPSYTAAGRVVAELRERRLASVSRRRQTARRAGADETLVHQWEGGQAAAVAEGRP